MWYTIQYNFVCRYVTESPWISAMYAVIHNYGNPYEKWNIFVARPHLWLQLGMVNGPITIAIRARFEYDSSTIRLQHATRFFCALAYEIDSSTPRESVVGVSCMLIDSSMHTIFTLYLYRPTLHRVCEYARNCLYKRN